MMWKSSLRWGLTPSLPCLACLISPLLARYDNPAIYVTENGFAMKGEADLPYWKSLNDQGRVSYIQSYIAEMYKAIHYDQVNVKGYYVWSLLDNFEVRG